MTLDFCLSEPEQLLCRAVADEPMEVRAAAARQLQQMLGDERAFALAEANQVAPIVAHALMQARDVDNVPAHWRQSHEATHQRISAYLAELDCVAAQLAESGIALVALKNGGVARGIYPCPGCCPMGDLDVLVEKRHFRAAHQVLLAEGYRFGFRSSLEQADLDAAEKNGSAEYWKTLPNGAKLWFELQWRPVAGRWIRPDQEPSAEELVARSMPIPGTAARLLSPEDNLLQVALHTAKHSYVRAPGLRLHTDIDRIVRRQSMDWDTFLKRVLALRVKTAVYFSLVIPHTCFETPIPSEVLTRLRPAMWKERGVSDWLQRAGLFNPDERKFGRIGFILFTALLYDDTRGLWRGIFPDSAWMRERYSVRSNWLLPYYHGRRLLDLVLRRTST